jgi:serine/threonine protein kinase
MPATMEPWTLGLEGYVDFHRVGRGGFATVYRARQVRLDRDVAVKVLSTDLSDPAEIRRFENECRVMGRLSRHPNIADVYDAGIGPQGEPYIVMKYYGGGTLAAQVATRGKLPVNTVLAHGAKLASALAASHTEGVIHRDVKPENVLLDEGDEPVLADFGVAAIADAEGRYTSSVAFSRSYAAPELLDRNSFGTASDVYSLGATLYTMLSGRPVFSSPTEARLILAILDEAPLPLEDPDVPPALESLVLRCLAKDPADRPLSAEAVGVELAALGSERATEVTAVPAVQNTGRETPHLEDPTVHRPTATAPSAVADSDGGADDLDLTRRRVTVPSSPPSDAESRTNDESATDPVGRREAAAPAAARRSRRGRWVLAGLVGVVVAALLAGAFIVAPRSRGPTYDNVRAARPYVDKVGSVKWNLPVYKNGTCATDTHDISTTATVTEVEPVYRAKVSIAIAQVAVSSMSRTWTDWAANCAGKWLNSEGGSSTWRTDRVHGADVIYLITTARGINRWDIVFAGTDWMAQMSHVGGVPASLAQLHAIATSFVTTSSG